MDLYGHPRRKTALALLKPEIEAPLERSDFAIRRTAASAAESSPRGGIKTCGLSFLLASEI